MHKGDKRKADILTSASELFGLKGYHKTTLQDIISQVGCSKGSFYHHFESKLQVLQALANQRVEKDYRAFADSPLPQGLDKLNRLLYFTCPWRQGEEGFMAQVLSLGLQEEGAVLTAHLREVRKQAFYMELVTLLEALREQGLAYYSRSSLPELLWDAHIAFADTLTGEICRLIVSGGTPASRALDMLGTARFQWERLLDLPFGSVDIVPAKEMLEVVETASRWVRLEDGQLRFDAGYAVPCQQLGKTL